MATLVDKVSGLTEARYNVYYGYTQLPATPDYVVIGKGLNSRSIPFREIRAKLMYVAGDTEHRRKVIAGGTWDMLRAVCEEVGLL